MSPHVDEVHISDAELRSSAELLTELQKAGGGESCMGQSTTSIQETCAAHVSSQIVRTHSAFLADKRPFFTVTKMVFIVVRHY